LNDADTVQGLEVLWTAISTVGFFLALLNLWESQRDKEALELTHRNGAGKILARGTLVVDTGRALVQALFMLIGLAAMTQPANAPPPNSGFAHAVAWTLIAAATIMALNSLVARITRRRLNRYLNEHAMGEEKEGT
jgi:hypothetical protein